MHAKAMCTQQTGDGSPHALITIDNCNETCACGHLRSECDRRATPARPTADCYKAAPALVLRFRAKDLMIRATGRSPAAMAKEGRSLVKQGSRLMDADRRRCRTSAALNPNPQSNSRQSMSDVASEWRMPSRQRPSEKEPAKAHPRRSHATLNGRPVPGARKCHDACGGCPRSRCRIAVPDQRGPLERDDFSSNRHHALSYYWSMIFSENRFPLFGIML